VVALAGDFLGVAVFDVRAVFATFLTGAAFAAAFLTAFLAGALAAGAFLATGDFATRDFAAGDLAADGLTCDLTAGFLARAFLATDFTVLAAVDFDAERGAACCALPPALFCAFRVARVRDVAAFRADEEEAGITPFLNRRPSLMCG
jgi:hypothetical protein